MARTVNAAEHAARRDAILDAAQLLILSRGYDRLTLQDILDHLQISKGAFYHYFDSKPAVIEALTERLVSNAEQAVASIVANADLDALHKLQRFFGELIRWKSVRQNIFATMLPAWYASHNIVIRVQIDVAVAKRLAPLLTAIVSQGVDENRFITGYPEQAGAIIIALIQALQDSMASQLLAAADRSADAPRVTEMVSTYAAHIEAIERYLGLSTGVLYRADSRAIRSWVDALRRAEPTVGEPM